MGRKSTFGFGRRKNYLFEGLVVLTVGAFIATTILVGIFIYLNSSIRKNEAAIATLSKELTTLQEQAEEIQSQEAEYKNQLNYNLNNAKKKVIHNLWKTFKTVNIFPEIKRI